MSSDKSLTLTDYSLSVMRAHASNNWLYFSPGGVLVLVMVVGDWFRIAQMSHMPFWEGQFVFVKHILEGGRLFEPCTSIVTVFFRFPASIPLTFTSSLQNRRDFLRISGAQGRKQGEREARVARTCEPPLARNSRFALASRLPHLRPCSPEIRKKSRLFCWLFY